MADEAQNTTSAQSAIDYAQITDAIQATRHYVDGLPSDWPETHPRVTYVTDSTGQVLYVLHEEPEKETQVTVESPSRDTTELQGLQDALNSLIGLNLALLFALGAVLGLAIFRTLIRGHYVRDS